MYNAGIANSDNCSLLVTALICSNEASLVVCLTSVQLKFKLFKFSKLKSTVWLKLNVLLSFVAKLKDIVPSLSLTVKLDSVALACFCSLIFVLNFVQLRL
ncbi:Uncharacterised protein [Mycoplasmoides gallisepticum]|uniref:Uncharacterized protein n=1 Tax=Mycoplasmoides gallisepticum TaxID=2096 RepID=A0A3B0PYL8_MYCGL|nr:Uncharacterised protein [Mycoplasmoides gallisepticum]